MLVVLFAVLASWFRLKYPHVTIGAVASSAPILQFDYITPWSSFYDGVSQDFKVTKLLHLTHVGFQLYLPDEKILSKYLRNVPDSVRQTRHLLTYVPKSPGHY